MSGLLDKIGSLLGVVAPTIGTAIGGPFGGMAAKAIVSALGLPETSTEDQIALAVQNATPADLLKLKEADQKFTTDLKKLDVDIERIHAADRDSARNREVNARDSWTPRILAAFVVFGFFGILGYLLAYGVPERGGDAVLILLGSLSAAFGAIVAYYFGSTAGSAEKTKLLASK